MFPETSTLLLYNEQAKLITLIIMFLGFIAIGIYVYFDRRKQKKQEKEWSLEQR